MEKRYLSLREIQLAELELLECFSDFCEKANLRFYLIGGTLLGAVRQKGFIPWDDDVDVCMPRPDYNRFLSMQIEGVLPDHIKRICGNEPAAPYAFTKLIDSRIYVETIYAENADRNIWIDIFPVDGLPENRIQRGVHYKKVELLQMLQGVSNAKIGTGKTRFRRTVKRFLKPVARMKTSGYCRSIEKLAQKYRFDQADTVGVVNGSLHGVQESMRKQAFLLAQRAFFERRYFPVFSCSHEYLQQIYGDYMSLPPERERKKHILSAWTGE